eukprot:s22_g57.t1
MGGPTTATKPIDVERARPNALSSVLRIANQTASKAKEKLSVLWSPKRSKYPEPPVPKLPATSSSARRNNHLGKKNKAVNISAIARRAGRAKEAVERLEEDFASNSSRKARKAIRSTVMAVFREASGGRMFPPTPERVKLLGGVLKAAEYKAAGNYLSEFKLMAIEAGYDWTDQLERVLKLCKRSSTRATGPKTKAKEVPLSAELFDFGVTWMLREIELALVAKDHISLDFLSKRVTFTLPVSKTDQEGYVVKRVLQCLCTEKICDVSCPFFVTVRLLDKMIALGIDHASVLNNGKKATKSQIVGDWRKIFGQGVSGHSARRTGALRYIRSGWSISQVAYLGRWKSSVIMEYAAEALESLPVNLGQTFSSKGEIQLAAPATNPAGQMSAERMEEIKVYLLAELEATKVDNSKCLRALDAEVEALKMRDEKMGNSLPPGVQAVASKVGLCLCDEGAAIHCWPNPENAVAEIARVLRPGGVFVLSTFMPRGPLRAMGTNGNPYRFWTEEELQLTRRCGLVDFKAITKDPAFIMVRVKKPMFDA